MSKNDPVMERMKSHYENRSKTYLNRRTPVIIRLDGKAFHTYTKGLDKPFDEGLIEDMQETAKFLCKEIQGAKCAYVQSDEINILVTDYDKLTTDAWFDYGVQKMTSISASLATAKFNQLRLRRFFLKPTTEYSPLYNYPEGSCFIDFQTLAYFDSRAFNIPKEEVSNYFLARQRDAVKNSVSMLAQSLYSHKELHKKNQSDMHDMIHEKGLNWNDLHFSKKRGTFIMKNTYVNGLLPRKANEESWLELAINTIVELDEKYYNIIEKNKKGFILKYKFLEDLVNPIIRTKWEVVETPMKFNNEVFKQWI